MTGYCFTSGEELIAICKKEGLTISEVMLRRQQELSDDTAESILKELKTTLHAMKRSVEEGLTEELESVSGLSGGDAMRLNDRAEKNALSGTLAAKAAAASMAVVEVNAAMGRIVAAPTAGASGILPGVLFTCAKERGWNDEKLLSGLLTAGAIGSIIAANASISGAEHGCQAETGSAAAMAAAAAAITAAAGAAAEDLPRITRPRRKAGTSFFAGRSAIQPNFDKNNADKHRF